jgi:phenylalanine-4-hydroxylase
MALIRNLHWWTVEYGLIGDLENPKVYGAGLLSSIGECSSALKKEVTKLPYSIDAIHYNFDITKPQPQLFVTPDFAYLNQVLEAFASQMALRKGGLEGLLKAIESENTATAVFTSGLQVSGIFSEVLTQNSEIVYLKTSGNTILCFKDKVLPGHGKEYHSHGFGSPVGRIKGSLKPPRLLSDKDLSRLGIIPQQQVEFEYESGIKVSGILRQIIRKEKHIVLMSFEACSVQYLGKALFEPSWGIYDMAVGEHINSVYSGPADPVAYGLQYEPPKEKTHKVQYPEDIRKLHQIYSQIKDIRSGIQPAEHLHVIWELYRKNFKSDWLLASEMLEVSNYNDLPFSEEISIHLKKIRQLQPEFEQVISNVLAG